MRAWLSAPPDSLDSHSKLKPFKCCFIPYGLIMAWGMGGGGVGLTTAWFAEEHCSCLSSQTSFKNTCVNWGVKGFVSEGDACWILFAPSLSIIALPDHRVTATISSHRSVHSLHVMHKFASWLPNSIWNCSNQSILHSIKSPSRQCLLRLIGVDACLAVATRNV